MGVGLTIGLFAEHTYSFWRDILAHSRTDIKLYIIMLFR
jgi:hypothetical protein